MYSSIYSGTQSSADTNEDSVLSNIHIHDIAVGMSYEQVISLWGLPHNWLTSSYRIAQYNFSDGRQIIITFSFNDDVLYVESIQEKGDIVYE